jgi:Rab family protein
MKELNIVIMGAKSVGKSAFVTRMITDQFQPIPAADTKRVIISDKTMIQDDTEVSISFIDLPGGMSQKEKVKQYTSSADIILLFFALDDVSSFTKIEAYLEVLHASSNKPQVVLVGNKSDLAQQINDEDITALTTRRNLTYFPISIKTREGIPELTNHIALQANKSRCSQRQLAKEAFSISDKVLRRAKEVDIRYQQFWTQTNDIKNIRHVLANYAGYLRPSLSRFCSPRLIKYLSYFYLALTGHIHRHHLQKVRKIIHDIDHNKLHNTHSIIDRLNDIKASSTHFNRSGSLSMRMTFIKKRCNDTNDEDKAIFPSGICCAN